MPRAGSVRVRSIWHGAFWITGYTLFLLLAQALWVARLPYPALRVDLLLPLMLRLAVEWPPVASFIWAAAWGYVMDVLSGQFWGFHVGSYMVTACLVTLASERLEFDNLAYQVAFVGLCAFGQAVALGLFLTLSPAVTDLSSSVWISLLGRGLAITFVAPLVIWPVSWMRGSRG